jgi:hypothetical protein
MTNVGIARGKILLVLALMMISCGGEGHVQEVQPVPPVAASSGTPVVPTSPSWPGVAYVKVRAYYSSQPFLTSFMQGIPEHVDDKDGVLLNADQERRLISAVTANVDPYEVFGCFEPRHVFIFYDSFDKPVAELDICFDCLVTVERPAIDGPSDFPSLADLVNDLGFPIGPRGVDAKAFRKAFDEFAKEQ